MRGLFSQQFMSGQAIFRDHFQVDLAPITSPPVIFGEMRLGQLGIVRDQYTTIITTPPTKVALKINSSGKLRLINGKLLLTQT